MQRRTSIIIRWIARISGSLIFVFLLPFYFGYDNPFPKPSLNFFENVWLTTIPLFMIGLLIGWKWEKIAGFMILIPLFVAFIVSLVVWKDPSFMMIFPLIPGILYLIYGYAKE